MYFCSGAMCSLVLSELWTWTVLAYKAAAYSGIVLFILLIRSHLHFFFKLQMHGSSLLFELIHVFNEYNMTKIVLTSNMGVGMPKNLVGSCFCGRHNLPQPVPLDSELICQKMWEPVPTSSTFRRPWRGVHTSMLSMPTMKHMCRMYM